jgi:peptide/nickel transport system substrate-binding protein
VALAGLAGTCLVPALAVGGQSAVAAPPEEKVTFTVAFQNEVDSLNPFVGIEAASFEAWALTYDYLIDYSMEDMSPEPGLATSWETSEDGLTWTFDIRDDVAFSDGEPLTAEDVAFTFSRILDGGPEAATWGAYLGQVTSATATDDTTLVLELKKPNSSLPLLPIPIVPEHIWKDVPEDEVKTYKAEPENGEPVVGSGPFRLVEGQAGGPTYRWEANPDYWKDGPYIDEVVFRVFKSEDPAIQALIKGEVDFVYDISALQVQALQGRDGISATTGDAPGFDEIAFNTGSVDLDSGEPMGDPNPAVLDPAFRYALGFAIDRDLLVERAYQGAGSPGSTIIPEIYDQFHWAPPEDVAFTYDPDRASELLDEAGYTRGGDGTRTLPDGRPMEPLRLIARSESPTSLDVMEFFQEWLADIGVPSEVTAMESSKLTDVILEGEFDAFEWGWYVEPDPTTMLSYMTCGQRGNWSDSWYCNEEYDTLYQEQQTSTDPEARADMVRQMQEMVFLDAPYLVTAYTSVGEAFRSDRFACLRPQPDPGGTYLVQYRVYNYLNMRPAAEAGDCGGVEGATEASDAGDDGGVGSGFMIGAGAVLGLLLLGGVVFAARRRSTTADRE